MSRSDGITIRPERPRRVVQFAESLIIPDGFNAGQKFRLLPFQKRLIRDIYGPHRDGLRVVRKAILSMGRKNSKSTWAAILMLAHLIGPETIRNGQLYSAASEGDQATIIFEIAAKILRADPELEAMVRIVDSTHTIIGLQSGSVYHSLTREAGLKMGKNPSFGVYDELAQARDRLLYDAMNTARGAQAEPLMLIISTQSEDPDHLLSKLIDDGITGADPTIVAHLYETPLQQPDGTETDIWDERNWKASNPALGKFRSLADMRAMAAEARTMARRSIWASTCPPRRTCARWSPCLSPTAHVSGRGSGSHRTWLTSTSAAIGCRMPRGWRPAYWRRFRGPASTTAMWPSGWSSWRTSSRWPASPTTATTSSSCSRSWRTSAPRRGSTGTRRTLRPGRACAWCRGARASRTWGRLSTRSSRR